MVDIDEEKGLKACTELQKQYSTQNVMFTHCDVTKSDELVSPRVCVLIQVVKIFVYIHYLEKCICMDQGRIWWH